jgi:hypothetical protein
MAPKLTGFAGTSLPSTSPHLHILGICASLAIPRMSPTLTLLGNSRVRRVLAAAALAGVELEYDNTFTFRSEWKTPEFLAKFRLGYLPVLEDGDLKLQESGAIAAYGESSEST